MWPRRTSECANRFDLGFGGDRSEREEKDEKGKEGTFHSLNIRPQKPASQARVTAQSGSYCWEHQDHSQGSLESLVQMCGLFDETQSYSLTVRAVTSSSPSFNMN